ncbi:MAG: general secretion pathway protein GspB [Thermodesulfovibrionales bacterium]
MSYILDALKKTEKERKRGSVPDIMTVQDIKIPGTKKRPLWILLILVVLLLNAAVLIWVSPWKSKKPQTVLGPAPDKQIVAKLQNASSKKNALQHSKKVNDGKDVRKEIKEKPKAMPETKITHEASSTTPRKKEEASDVVSEAKPDNDHLPLPLPNKIYHMSELPQSIQQKLPDFAISTFLYSGDPSSRSVRINGQMIREGQYLSAGLKLEEIIQNGMIFSYQNYRFQVGLK